MRTRQFLVGSIIVVSAACAGVASADEQKAVVVPGKMPATGAPVQGNTQVHSVGNDKLRFTVTERRALEQYSSQQKTRERAGENDDDHRDTGHGGKHGDGHDKKHDKGYEKQKSLPPGLQKKQARGEGLPPGWKKKLARGQVMPETVYTHARPLPDDVRRNLPKDPPGTVTVQVDGEIVRVLENTRQIVDIFRSVR